MRIEQKFVDIAVDYSKKEAKRKSVIFNDRDIDEFKKTLKDIAKGSKYTEGQNISQNDIVAISVGMDKVFDGVAQNFAHLDENDKRNVNLKQYSMLAYGYLISLVMKELNCPEIPTHAFLQNASKLAKNIVKEQPTQAVSLDDTYKQQRGINAADMDSHCSVDYLIKRVQNGTFSPDELCKLYAEYRALSKRQANHGRIWRFFHSAENEARNNMLKNMENAIKMQIPEDMLTSNASAEEIMQYGKWKKEAEALPIWMSAYEISTAAHFGYDAYKENPELLEKMNLNANKEPEIENKENDSKDIELDSDENEIKAEDIDRHVEDLLKVSLDTSLDLDGANVELEDDALASEDNLFELDNTYDINGESFELDNEDNPLADVNFQEEPQVEIPELDAAELERIKLQADNKVMKRNKPESRRTDAIKATSRINAKNLLKTSKDKVLEDFVDTLVAADMDENNKMIMCKSLYTDLILKMDNTWMHPEKMGDYANTIFTSVYNKINTDVSNMTIGDKLVATQEIIDIAFNSFTPVATDPKLARYGDNYCIRSMDAEEIQELTGYKGDVDELMNNVKIGLGIIKEKKEEKEHVEFLNGEFKEEVGDKAQKIEDIKPPYHGKSIE